MRYIYALKNKKRRNQINLKKYASQIQRILETLNLSNNSYLIVHTNSFCKFRLI